MKEFIPKELPVELELTPKIYKALNLASRKLGELNGFIKTIPNQDILINSLVLQEAKDSKKAIDATYGRRTRSVIIMDSGHIILSAVQPETIAGRVDNGLDDDDE